MSPKANQDTIVELIHTSIRVLSGMLDDSSDLPRYERQALVDHARGLIADIRKAEGTIQNPEMWQKIHSLADGVQTKLDKI